MSPNTLLNKTLAAKVQDTSWKQRKKAETVNKNCQGQGRLHLGGQWERCECFHPIGGLTSRCSRTEEPKPATCFSHFHQYKHSSLVSLHGDYCFSELSFSLWKKKSTPEVLLKVWRQGKYSINQNQESSWYFTHLTHRERKAHCRTSLYCSFCYQKSEAIGLGRADGSEYFCFISVVDKTKHWQKAAYGRKRRFIIWQFQITVHRSTEVTGAGALSSWSHPTVKSKEE